MIAGSEPSHAALLNPGRLIAEMIARFHSAALSKGLDLQVGPYSDWHDVVTDDTKVRQIVGSLLGNAIKHTSSGWVRLTVTPPDGMHWGITIEDTGEGMAPAHAAHVFDEPAWISDTLRRSDAAPGLPICKQLVDQLEGNIVLRSALGRGTQLKIRLPVMLRSN